MSFTAEIFPYITGRAKGHNLIISNEGCRIESKTAPFQAVTMNN